MQPATDIEARVATGHWACLSCGFIYDEALGLPDEGIGPCTRWEDVPADWYCPQCGAGKDDFEMVPLVA
jgi:rubredoxin